MEKLANLTPTDINNGVLNRILANVGIPDVQQYVKTFHQETEELIIEEFENPDLHKINNDEQIVPPHDIYNLINGLRIRTNDPIKPPISEQQQQQQLPQDIPSLFERLRPVINNTDHNNLISQELKQPQPKLPADVQSWITGLRLPLDDPIQPPVQQQEQKPLPTNLSSWMQGIAPVHLHSSTDITTIETTTTYESETTIHGNLNTWLNDWSKSLAEQPPPTSLDTWLHGLVSEHISDPIDKASNPKGRLNTYLNAAQEVLSKHGYDVSNEINPSINIQSKPGKGGNVKQMYFLWKTLDKNKDGKVTVEDVQIMLQELGLGFLSKYVAETLFNMVDTNHDGTLQFRDFIAFMGIIKQLIGAAGSAKA